MSQYQIAIVVGSLRKASINRQLAQALRAMLPQQVGSTLVEIGDLPLYNQDHDGQEVASVLEFRDALRPVHGVLFVTPEYNRSIPGVLKNALDQGSRPYGRSVWAGKPAAVLGVSPGAMGTALAQQHLRNVLANLDMPTLAQPEMFLQAKEGFFNADGSLNERSATFVQGFVDRWVQWLAQHAT